MKKNEQGIAAVIEVILAVVVLGGIGFVGYRVMQSGDDKKTASTTSATKKTETWTKGAAAVTGKYADADVVKVSDTTYRMYYATQPEGGVLDVYSSTSTDGKTWTQDSGKRKSMATFPSVIKLSDGRYRMYFQSASLIKSAISTDGLSFTDEAGTRIDKTNPDNLVLDNVAAPTVMVQKDGTYVMVYRGTINTRYDANTPNPTTQLLLWATSTDGLTFTKKGIAVDTRNTTLNGQLDGPDFIAWEDGKDRIYATTYTGVYSFEFNGTTFDNPVLAFADGAKQDSRGFTGAPPGDPTVIKIGSTWFMYYGGTGADSGIHYATLQ